VLDQLKETNASLTDQVANLQSLNSSSAIASNQAMDAVQKELEDMKTANTSLRTQIDQSKLLISQSEQSVHALQAAHDAYMTEQTSIVSSLRSSLETSQLNLEQRDDDVAKLKEMVQEIANVSETQRNELDVFKAEIDSHIKTIELLQSQVDALNMLNAELNNVHSNMSASVAGHTASTAVQQAQLQVQLQTREIEVKSLLKDLQDVTALSEQQQVDISGMQLQIQGLIDEREELKALLVASDAIHTQIMKDKENIAQDLRLQVESNLLLNKEVEQYKCKLDQSTRDFNFGMVQVQQNNKLQFDEQVKNNNIILRRNFPNHKLTR
jgi:hypothetical protein